MRRTSMLRQEKNEMVDLICPLVNACAWMWCFHRITIVGAVPLNLEVQSAQ